MNFLKLLIAGSLILGCTDADRSKFTTLGKRSEAICWSGDKIIFHGISTGRVQDAQGSDGYYAVWEIVKATGFTRVKRGKKVPFTVSGNCVIGYID